MKKIFLVLLPASLLVLNSCSCSCAPVTTTEPEPTTTSTEPTNTEPVETPEEKDIREKTTKLNDDFSETNYTADYELWLKYGTEELTKTTDYVFEVDSEKMHMSGTAMSTPIEAYVFKEGDKTIERIYVSEMWQPPIEVAPYALYSSIKTAFKAILDDFDTFVAELKTKLAKDETSTYVAKNVNYTLNAAFYVSTNPGFAGYTCTQETLAGQFDEIKIQFGDNGHVTLFEIMNHGFTAQTDEEHHTITFVNETVNYTVTKWKNLRNFGTTVVNLPSFE